MAATACWGDDPTDSTGPGPVAHAISISPSALDFAALNETRQLAATVFDQSGGEIAAAPVTWATSNAQIATISASGLVTAIANGPAEIMAVSGSVSATAEVVVAQTQASLSLSTSTVALTSLGDTATLSASVLDSGGSAIRDAALAWSSTDEDVASVEEAGLVTAMGIGQTWVTATSGPVSDSLPITVDQVAVSIDLNPTSVSLAGPGDTATVAAVVRDGGGAVIVDPELSWLSDNEATANASAEGLVTGLAAGSAAITVEVAAMGPPVTGEVSVEVGDGVLTGPAGAEVSVADGAVHLAVPAGALAELVYLTAKPRTGLTSGSAAVPGTVFEFGPDGLVFGVPATLTIGYDPADVPQGVPEEELRLHRLVGDVWTLVEGSTVDVIQHTVGGAIEGFSVYAVLHELGVTTTSLPEGSQNVDYGTQTLEAAGGNGSYTWAVVTGALPAGLSLTPGGDVIGTPTLAGTASFVVQATDGWHTAEQALSITVHPTLSVTTASLSNSAPGVAYAEMLEATGGNGTYSWAVAAGSLPSGLSLSANGAIVGTPTSAGTSDFSVEVTSGDGQMAQRALSITVTNELVIFTSSLPSGVEDESYGPESLVATGAEGGYAWTVASGALPVGLSLSPGGVITGTAPAAGTSGFTVEVASGVQSVQRALSITVYPVLAVSTNSLPDGVEDVDYGTQVLDATGGTLTYAWAVVSGVLPPGLSLSASGTLTGTPTASGTSSFIAEVTSGGQTAQGSLSITVHPTLRVTTTSLPDGVEDEGYATQSLEATGGTGDYTWAVLAGSLPSGMSLTASGDVAGTPTSAGTSGFTVEVTSGGQAAQGSLSITVHPTLRVTTSSLPDGVEDAGYDTQSLAATGGAGGYTWAVVAGSLPPGLGLSASGTLTGTPTASGTSSFTVEVTSGVQTAARPLAITVHPTLQVTINAIPDGTEGESYGPQPLTATGGTGAYAWTVASGSLPPGLSLSPSGQITGTPSAAGTFSFTVEVTSGTQAAQGALSMTVSGPPAEVIILTQPSSSAQSGVQLSRQPVVRVLDSGGSAVADVDVAASVSSVGGTLNGTTTVQTDANGVATFTDLSLTGSVGDHTISFTAGSASSDSDAVTLGAGPPTSVVISTQPSPTAQSGEPLTQQPSVDVTDDGGNPVSGVDVAVSIASGGGALGGGTSVTTDGAGRATFSGLSIVGAPGDRTLRFQAGSVSVVSGSIVLVAGPPALATIVTQPSSSAQSGVAFAQQPSVDIEDGAGNAVGDVDVEVTIASGGGTLGGPTTVATNAAGRATFSGLSITGTPGVRTLRFDAGSADVVSGSIDLTSGEPALMTIVTQPSSSAQSGVTFGQQPVVEVLDEGGNPTAGSNVTATIASGGGVLGGTTTVVTDAEGVATFTDLSISGLVGERTLSLSSGSASIESGTVVVGAGPAASIVLVTQPPALSPSGGVFDQQPSLEVYDDAGNPVDGVDVDVSIASGGGSLAGTTTVSTDASGAAAFPNLSISGSPGARTLAFDANAASTTSSSVHVSYGQGTYLDVQYCGSLAAQRMDVYVPSNSFARPLPVAAYIHGGGWTSGDKANGVSLPEVRDELLSRGYVVVSLNYRLASSTANQWPAQIHDVKCAIRHVRAEASDYGSDGERIGVWGSSAGGHLSAMAGVTDAGSGLEGPEGYGGVSSRVKAAVVVAGISDLTQGPEHPELNFSGPEKAFKATWPGPSTELNEASPISWTSSDDPPFLIVHGDLDLTVLPAQAVRLRDYLNSVGTTVTLQMVTDGGHNLEDVGAGTPSPSLVQVAEQIADFLDTHVRFNP